MAGRLACDTLVSRSNDGIDAVAAAGDGVGVGGFAEAVVRAAEVLVPPPDVGVVGEPDAAAGAGVATGLPYVVPWLFVAGRVAPLAAPPDAEAADADAGVLFAAAGFVGLDALVGVEAAAPELADGVVPAAAGLAAPVPAPLVPPCDPAAGAGAPAALVVAGEDASVAPGLVGCFGAVGLADGAAVLPLRPVSRDGVVAPPTVALPTVAFPTAADARAGPLEF
ncbi:hypothetical protein [Cryptosporangium aurantiacum]|uniref:hypothetical protein n=1 Tax=Cryptosporangium aurantiacum TaxID=134849 RepID=UPI001C49E5DA|nr:hypothetical protein [Cryptosporangium aurantiacum]